MTTETVVPSEKMREALSELEGRVSIPPTVLISLLSDIVESLEATEQFISEQFPMAWEKYTERF